MTTPLQEYSPEYARLLQQHNELERIGNTSGLTGREYARLCNLKRQLNDIEAAFDQRASEQAEARTVAQSPFAAVCEDYEETMRWAGSVE